MNSKSTELKAGDHVLVKHTTKKDKLTNYSANDLFTVAKVNGHAIIVKRKRDGKVLVRNILMVKKQKRISDSNDHSDIDSSGSPAINTENTHIDDRECNTDKVVNVDSENILTWFILHTKSTDSVWRIIHTLKNYKDGEDMCYMRWILNGLCICGIWTLYVDFVYTLGYVVYTILKEVFLVN